MLVRKSLRFICRSSLGACTREQWEYQYDSHIASPLLFSEGANSPHSGDCAPNIIKIAQSYLSWTGSLRLGPFWWVTSSHFSASPGLKYEAAEQSLPFVIRPLPSHSAAMKWRETEGGFLLGEERGVWCDIVLIMSGIHRHNWPETRHDNEIRPNRLKGKFLVLESLFLVANSNYRYLYWNYFQAKAKLQVISWFDKKKSNRSWGLTI